MSHGLIEHLLDDEVMATDRDRFLTGCGGLANPFRDIRARVMVFTARSPKADVIDRSAVLIPAPALRARPDHAAKTGTEHAS